MHRVGWVKSGWLTEVWVSLMMLLDGPRRRTTFGEWTTQNAAPWDEAASACCGACVIEIEEELSLKKMRRRRW